MNDESLLDAYLNTEIIVDYGDTHLLKISATDECLIPQQDVFEHLRIEASAGFVITAWNPFSVILKSEMNHANQDSLLKKIVALSRAVLPARGCSPDGSWCEDSLMVFAASADVDVVREEIRALAIEFGQNAFFEITRSEILVIGAIWEKLRAVKPYKAILTTT